MTPTNEAGHGLPELPEWSKRDDLGGLVPSQIRSELRAYARDALALSRGVPADMVLVPVKPTEAMLDAMHESIRIRCDPNKRTADIKNDTDVWAAMLAAAPAAAGAQGEGGCDCMGCGEIYSHGEGWFTCPYCKGTGKEIKEPQPAAVDGGVRECPACKGAGEVMLPVWTHDPQDGYDAMGECPKCGGNGSAFPQALESLSYFTEHCLSAADEGEDYSTQREWLDAMTTMGIMKKTGRGKWAPTEQAQPVADALAALSSHRQAGEDLAKFRELAERWREAQKRAETDGVNATTHAEAKAFDYESLAYKECADELIALVEKGAGS